jgi:alpha-tubulin suppressor-like RCC1 family protein
MAVSVSTGGAFTCVVLDDATLKCFGLNYHGTLGTCWALDTDGNVGSCFDPLYRNWTRGYGLGSDQMGDLLPIVDLGPNAQIQQITTGSFFSCALLSTGAVKCFGDNTQGQLGLGDRISRGDQPNQMGAALPVVNSTSNSAVDWGTSTAIRTIASGNEHSCAVLVDESIRCWGSNSYNQLQMN